MSTPCLAVDLVTFDVGNTLLTLRPDQAREWSIVLAEVGVTVDAERISAALQSERPRAAQRRQVSVPADHQVSVSAGDERRKTFVENVLKNVGLGSDTLEVGVKTIRSALDSPRMYQVFDDTLPTLRALWLRGLKLGVVSNTWPSMPRILMALGFDEYLGFWVISEFAGVEKPDRAIFERALEIGAAEPGRAIFERALEIGAAEPGRAVHVGDDYESDVCGARAAGMAAVLVDRDGAHADFSQPGVRVVRGLDELLGMIG